jgi:hypothetical protein
MPAHSIAAVYIGSIARQILGEVDEASVMGVTSRGVFLRVESSRQWVVFLSYESWCGPLTINLDDSGEGQSRELFRRLEVGSPARISADRIAFPDVDVALQIGQAQVWEAPLPPQTTLLAVERKARLADVVWLALEGRQDKGLGRLLPLLLGLKAGPGLDSGDRSSAAPTVTDTGDNLQLLLRLQEALHEGCNPGIVGGLEALLGLGSGLTPSGDDLAMGLLLALSRWGHVLAGGLDVTTLAARLLPPAYLKTTMLSANLIECASLGQADERLLFALDGLVSGIPEAAECAAALAEWGSSSGADALVGMALVL